MSDLTTTDRAYLRSALGDAVTLPGEPEFEQVRAPALARFADIRPQAVARCARADQIVQAVRWAARTGTPLAIRSGGHSFAGHSSSTGLIIDVSPMDHVVGAESTVTVGAGTQLGALYDTLAVEHRTVPAGCGPSVGVAGLTLGGGLGILGRKYGLTCDSLRAAEVVLADGRIVHCDQDRYGDLFWALRGAGAGNFGVVTSLVFDTVPAPDATAFHLTWPFRHAAAVVAGWQDWAPDGPDELAASLLVRWDGHDRAPQVHVFGTMLDSLAGTGPHLHELVSRVGAEPDSAEHRYADYRTIKAHLAGLFESADQTGPTGPQAHGYLKSGFFARSLPIETIDAVLADFATPLPPGQARELDFAPSGGAYARIAPSATAFPHRDARFLLKHAVRLAAGSGPDAVAAARQWLTASWSHPHPLGTGGVYVNFPDPDLADWATAYYGRNLPRLRAVKRAYDPGDLFRHDQSVPG